MATQEYAAAITGVGIRVTRLDALGNLLNGPGDSYTTSAFMRVSFTPEYEEGDEFTEKGASGAVCVSYKAPDTLKRITMEIAICEPDPELTNLLSGGLLLRKNLGSLATPENRSIGWASPAIGDDPSGNGVAVEAWQLAIKDGKKSGVLPYFHWIFPYVKVRASGDRVIENGLLANTFEGQGLGNIEFGTGPDERWEFPITTSRPYSWARSDWAPSGYTGFYTWHGVINAAVNKVARAANVTTLTTAAEHGFSVGDTVTVTGLTNDTATGVFQITGVPTPTTFTYGNSGANITAVTDAGGAEVAPGGSAVDDLSVLSGQTETDFNVPGNVSYSSDRASDFIVRSIEDAEVI